MDGGAFNGLAKAVRAAFLIGAGAVIGCIVLLAYVIWSWATEPDWQREAISRGFATYCADNGEFAWRGECKQEGGE